MIRRFYCVSEANGVQFWVCWEPTIVQPFYNAPAPASSSRPETLGITVDRTTLGSSVLATGSLARFLEENFRFACQDNFLGVCTALGEKLDYNFSVLSLYEKRRLSALPAEMDALADMHDHLVDSAKNGYTLPLEEWLARTQRVKALMELRDPAYKDTEELLRAKDGGRPNYNKMHIIDHLVFDVARDAARQIIKRADEKLAIDGCLEDKHLTELYTYWSSSTDEIVKSVMIDLISRLDYKSTNWPSWCRVPEGQRDWRQDTDACHRRFQSIMPWRPDYPVVASWLRPFTKNAPREWDLIKASTLYKLCGRKTEFITGIALEELCYIKAHSVGKPSLVVPTMFSKFKMRKLTGRAVSSGEDSVPEGEDDIQVADGQSDDNRDMRGDRPYSIQLLSQDFADSTLDDFDDFDD